MQVQMLQQQQQMPLALHQQMQMQVPAQPMSPTAVQQLVLLQQPGSPGAGSQLHVLQQPFGPGPPQLVQLVPVQQPMQQPVYPHLPPQPQPQPQPQSLGSAEVQPSSPTSKPPQRLVGPPIELQLQQQPASPRRQGRPAGIIVQPGSPRLMNQPLSPPSPGLAAPLSPTLLSPGAAPKPPRPQGLPKPPKPHGASPLSPTASASPVGGSRSPQGYGSDNLRMPTSPPPAAGAAHQEDLSGTARNPNQPFDPVRRPRLADPLRRTSCLARPAWLVPLAAATASAALTAPVCTHPPSLARQVISPLERGVWTLTRVVRRVACDACAGTEAMQTTAGGLEVFRCTNELAPGGLAAACLHDVAPPSGVGPAGRRVWVFCPDPLCMSSKPEGSCLPAWPWDLPLGPGLGLTSEEAEALTEFELGVVV